MPTPSLRWPRSRPGRPSRTATSLPADA
jgi:hypothetical protein